MAAVLSPEDLALMERYGAMRAAWNNLVDHCSTHPTPELRRKAKHAADRIEDLKLSLGEPEETDPLCCRRYSRLHRPEFSVPGCRWYLLREKTAR